APGGWPAGQAWPPADARPVPAEELDGQLIAAGYGDGAASQGIDAVWVRGREVYAEVTLPPALRTEAGRYRLHPALLDAALRAATAVGPPAAGPSAAAPGQVMVPSAWTGVTVRSPGAARLRVRAVPTGGDEDGLTLTLHAAAPPPVDDDGVGDIVATVEAVVSRPIAEDRVAALAGGGPRSLFRLAWIPLSAPTAPQPSPSPGEAAGSSPAAALSAVSGGVLDLTAAPLSAEPGAARALTAHALEWLRERLQQDTAPTPGAPLVVLTRHAVDAAHPDEAVADPGAAAVWGLVRAAQTEHPGRIILVDTDEVGPDSAGWGTAGPDSGSLATAVAAAVAAREPQVAVRSGRLLVPRVVPISGSAAAVPAAASGPEVAEPPRPTLADGTVLITGGTGTLGALVARHLVRTHAVRDLLLLSRRGLAAPGAPALVAELAEVGARARVAAVDAADHDAIAALLAEIPPARPLTAVVHTAGTIDDGVLAAQTADRLATVFRPKADAAWNLHRLTAGIDLAAFVLFSSGAGVFGGAGQANYAAANGYLDGLARLRRGLGLPAVSVAWGLWARASGLTGELDAADHARLAREGVRALPDEEALALFDAAVRAAGAPAVSAVSAVPAVRDRPAAPAGAGGTGDAGPGTALLVATGFAEAALRLQAAEGRLPALLRELVDASPARRVARPTLRARLAGLAPGERDRLLLELVRGHAATVLGHREPAGVAANRAFRELGVDSLAAVELRNRLAAEAGVALPATVVFDHPSPLALAEWLAAELAPPGPGEADSEAAAGAGRPAPPVTVGADAGAYAAAAVDLIAAMDADALIARALGRAR
ncbi:type I polyketide synthase, partial [Parafrankia sp. EUN1f]|uniref:type I polyketide synthase n=1 Tax=Parafrankia sp. EUN1f TaxID=102897 RepID=UPI0001C45A63